MFLRCVRVAIFVCVGERERERECERESSHVVVVITFGPAVKAAERKKR